MTQEFSSESRQALSRFFEENVNLRERSIFLAFGDEPAPWIEKCASCETPRNQLDSYSLGGVLLGRNMIYDPYPLCLCGKCEKKIQELLSQKTKGTWDDFVDSHFDAPPANVEDLPIRVRPLPF